MYKPIKKSGGLTISHFIVIFLRPIAQAQDTTTTTATTSSLPSHQYHLTTIITHYGNQGHPRHHHDGDNYDADQRFYVAPTIIAGTFFSISVFYAIF